VARLTVVGAGYVGLVTVACMSDLGHNIVAMDLDASKIETLRAGEAPIYEPGLAELIAKNRERIEFTTDPAYAYKKGEYVFLCVDTPSTYSGDADLSRIWQAVDNLPPDEGRHILITKSTVPVGTGAAVQAELTARGYGHISYASNPEFLREGSAIADFTHPDRIVVGADDPAVADKVAALYTGIDAPLVKTDVASAEMIKYASNAFLATKISFINEIANVCEATGADVTVVARGMGLDKRIGPHFLQAGIGYGGSCFPKDVSALKQIAGNTGYHFQLLNAVIEVNELQKRRVISKLKRYLGDELRGCRIALLGLAFKPNTDDIREASSIILASRLIAEGAEVVAYDPIAVENTRGLLPKMVYAGSALETLTGADACVLVTE
jgi:UDPglucose 6-dehydrogenase